MGQSENSINNDDRVKSEAETGSNEQLVSAERSGSYSMKGKFPIVGIGASAGGLQALERLFSSMPKNTRMDMAFVVIQHLSPDYESMLSKIIDRYTNMDVQGVKDGMTVSPNSVYVIPPDKAMVIKDGVLNLMEPAKPRGQRTPIDHFFSSLASDMEELAIGIILSGTGSDGVQGIRDIKAKGGMAMAQSPESSKYNGMPKTAIQTGLVDYILEPDEMPAQLKEYVSQMQKKKSHPSSRNKEAMDTILSELRNQTDHDFSQYKPQTLNRRIMRRMVVNKTESLEEYANYLKENPEEADALFRDLLISVTSFFRNPSVFKALVEKVIPHLFEGKDQKESIRVWVAGCSTGEEAYSIAILLKEHMEKLNKTFKVQIFASDIDTKSIEKARKGVFPASIADNVSSERLDKYFMYDSENETYSIVKNVREMLLFSEHNVIKDPPFSNIDFVSCRNLLIYMNVELQNYVIPVLHYSLKPGGYLLLGSSESIRDYSNLFKTLDYDSRIFKSRAVKDQYQPHPGIGIFFPSAPARDRPQSTSDKQRAERKLHMRELTERDLLENYAPAAVLVDKQGDIFYLHGNANTYLHVPVGEPSNNIIEMAPEELKQELSRILRKAVVLEKKVVSYGVRFEANGDTKAVDLTVRPLQGADKENLFIVIFDVASEPSPGQKEKYSSIRHGDIDAEFPDEDGETIAALKEELRTTEEYLKTSNEELAVSNEDLRASNEELQSTNEELQSTNEELETSREEMESLNEELSSVNNELQGKVEDLSNINENINKMLSSTGISMIFVDTQLRIQRFTPAAREIIELVSTDVGRPIGHFAINLSDYDRLTQDIRSVLDTLEPVYKEVQSQENEWYLLTIHPFSSEENELEGAAVTFIDITQLKELQQKQRETLDRMAAVINDSRDAILLQDTEGNIIAWNPAAKRMYGWSEEEALDMNISAIVPEDHKEKISELREKAIKNEYVWPYKTQRLTKKGKVVDIWLTATTLADKDDEVYAIATTERYADENSYDESELKG